MSADSGPRFQTRTGRRSARICRSNSSMRRACWAIIRSRRSVSGGADDSAGDAGGPEEVATHVVSAPTVASGARMPSSPDGGAESVCARQAMVPSCEASFDALVSDQRRVEPGFAEQFDRRRARAVPPHAVVFERFRVGDAAFGGFGDHRQRPQILDFLRAERSPALTHVVLLRLDAMRARHGFCDRAAPHRIVESASVMPFDCSLHPLSYTLGGGRSTVV